VPFSIKTTSDTFSPTCSNILLHGCGEKVIFHPFFKNIGKSRLSRKPTFGQLFATVQESRLRAVVKKYFFQKDDIQSS
jgi:hypothetical protein